MDPINQRSIIERIPPQNLEAEMAVLGSMLIDENAINAVLETVNETHFYKEDHRRIFSAIINLYNKTVQNQQGKPS